MVFVTAGDGWDRWSTTDDNSWGKHYARGKHTTTNRGQHNSTEQQHKPSRGQVMEQCYYGRQQKGG